MRRGLLIGCGGLLGLFVLLVIVAAIVGGGSEETATQSDSEDKKQEDKQKDKASKKKDEGQTVQVGQPVRVGDLEWMVTNARQANQLNSQFLEPKQGNFVIVDLRFTNNGNEAITVTQQSVALLDSSGRESEPDTDTFGYIEPQRNIFLEQVNPGVTRDGEAIFTVAPDAQGFRLRVGDARLFSNENGFVDLGF